MNSCTTNTNRKMAVTWKKSPRFTRCPYRDQSQATNAAAATRGRARRQVERLAELQEEERGFDAFAADHQQREQKHAGERPNAGAHRLGVQVLLDLALHAPAGPPHVDGQRGHGDGRHEGQRPIQPLLVGGVVEQVPPAGADGDGGDNAPVDGLGQLGAPALAQVRQADGHDEERFEPFPERDDERLQHDPNTPNTLELRLNLRKLQSSLLPKNPTGQVSNGEMQRGTRWTLR